MRQAKLDKYRAVLAAMHPDLRDEIQHRVEVLPEELRAPGDDWREPSELFDSEMETERVDETLFGQVAAALERLDAGTFGKCLDCGRAIPEARLDAVPYTAYCIDCERNHEANPA
jgi:RNA polymerase-binding protein DksA